MSRESVFLALFGIVLIFPHLSQFSIRPLEQQKSFSLRPPHTLPPPRTAEMRQKCLNCIQFTYLTHVTFLPIFLFYGKTDYFPQFCLFKNPLNKINKLIKPCLFEFFKKWWWETILFFAMALRIKQIAWTSTQKKCMCSFVTLPNKKKMV